MPAADHDSNADLPDAPGVPDVPDVPGAPDVPDVRLRATLPLWLLALFAVAAIALFSFPHIDLAVSGVFADGANGFPLQHDRVLQVMNRGITWATRLAGLVLLILTLLAWLPRKLLASGWGARLAARKRAIAFLLVALALGPGLLVNSVLKDHSGRARPVTIEQFGGTQKFTPAFAPADQCRRNCAFVSGHAAVAAFLFAGWFVARSRSARRGWLAAGLLAGLAVGVARMATGSHFLSDVLVAMMLIWIVTAACAAVLLRRAPVRGVQGAA